MKSFVVCLATLGIVLSACSKKSDPVAVTPPTAVTKITRQETYTNGTKITTTTTYEYNSDNTLAKSTQTYSSVPVSGTTVNATSTLTYTYTSGSVSSIIDSNDGTQSAWTNASGRLTTATTTSGGGVTIHAKSEFTYDSQGKIASNKYTDDLGAGTKVTSTFAFDGSGNLSATSKEVVVGSLSNGIINVSNYTFDGKSNPYSLLAKAINQPYFAFGAYGVVNFNYYSKNNVLTESISTYAYEYNDAGFPTKVTESAGIYTAVTTFEYK